MISVKEMTLKTREKILDNFSYTFEKENFYHIVAENGAGKTSFLRALTSLISYDGQVTIDDESFAEKKNRLFFFESNEWLNPNLTAKDYLQMIKFQWNSSLSIKKEAHLWGVDEYWNVPIKKYSLGMKQKLIIAMYFLSDADYFLMDEITNGLDQSSRQKFYDQLKQKLQHKCIIYTSHYADKIEVTPLIRLNLENLTMKEQKIDELP